MSDIATWAESAHGFYVDRYYDRDRWVLRPGPIRLAAYHRDILRHCFTPGPDGCLPYDTIGWCEPAKSGKSAIAGLVAEYAALHLDRNSQVIMASNKRDQAASLMFRSLTDSVELNPHLPGVESGKYEAAFSNGNVVRAIPSNSRGEAGARFSLVVFDELWGYVYQDALRLWSEFKTDPTRLHSMKLATGYGGYVGESDLWLDLLNRGLAGQPVPELAHVANDGQPACWANGRHFTFWSHQTRQPWQTDAWIESQRRSLRPPDYARMILCEFAEGVGDFVDQAAWEACIDPSHKPLSPGSEHQVWLGLDVATAPGGDDCALVGVYPEDGLVKLAFHQIWKGRERRRRLRLGDTVFPYLARVNHEYRVTGVWFDPYQALHLTDELRNIMPCYPVQQTHSSRGPKDTALWQMVASGGLVLYDDPDVRRAARSASAKELGNNLIFLVKAGGRAKIDFLVALSNVADEAARGQRVWVW